MTLSNTVKFALLALAIFATAVAFVLFQRTQEAGASVSQGSDYMSTSTAPNTVHGATISDSKAIRVGSGSFGSVNILGVNTGVVNFYDATTTDVNKRTGQVSTSTILLASFPSNAATGTYQFDQEFSDGLYLELASGIIPTSSISYRP